MLDLQAKERVKGLLDNANSLINDRKELTKDIRQVLKENSDYQVLLEKKKALLDEIKEMEEELIEGLMEEKKQINSELSIVKEDLSVELEIKKKISSKLINFYKVKLDNNEDELDVLATTWVEIFNT